MATTSVDIPETPKRKRGRPSNGLQLIGPKRKRGRPAFSINDPKIKEMLDYYADGMPRYIICEEFGINGQTLKRLIEKYEATYGEQSLRSTKIMRYS